MLTALAIGAILPLSLLKDMAALSKTSFISLLSVVFILGVVILNAVVGPKSDTRLPTRPVRPADRHCAAIAPPNLMGWDSTRPAHEPRSHVLNASHCRPPCHRTATQPAGGPRAALHRLEVLPRHRRHLVCLCVRCAAT